MKLRLLSSAVLWLATSSSLSAQADTVIATVAAGITPLAVAINPVTNKIYVVNAGSNNVTVIDGATNATTTIAVGRNPYSVAINQVTNKIYVTNALSSSVSVIDGATNATTTIAVIPSTLLYVAVNSVTNKIYVTNGAYSSVLVIDGATNAVTTVPVGSNPFYVAVNPVTNKIYVSHNLSNSVTVIDGVTNITSTVAVGTQPTRVAVNIVTNKAYVANNGTCAFLSSSVVTVIDGMTNATTSVAAGGCPYAVAVNTATNKIYVANVASSNVTVIDGATNATTTVAVSGPDPQDVAVNSVTNKIYVANVDGNSVTVIDGATNATTTIAAGSRTIALAVNDVTNRIYVANQNSNNVTVIGSSSGCPDMSFAAVVRGRVVPEVSSAQTTISATFQPGCGLSLSDSAKLGNYDHFNWVQVITEHDGLALCQQTNPIWPADFVISPFCLTMKGLLTSSLISPAFPTVPFFDPPAGGFLYMVEHACLAGGSCDFPVEDSFPWYEDELYDIDNKLATGGALTQAQVSAFNSNTLFFSDEPSCEFNFLYLYPCTIKFTTVLAGVWKDGTGEALNIAACATGPLTCRNIGSGFKWHVTDNTIGIDQHLRNSQSGPRAVVSLDGFIAPGAAGFSQPELELFAKNGINVRDDVGVTIPAVIDIKPGGLPNSINPQSNGKTPVAIISTTGFLAPSQVDQSSLTFGHTGNEQSLAFCSSQDVNRDGILDLVCQFYTSLTAFQPGDTKGILKGKTLVGTPIYGTDSVVIVPPQ
jgi:YVTN family beta-propeller protein